MIVLKSRAEAIGITQEDQAAFSAALLEEWNDQSLKHEPRREQIIRATRECNNGFREYDAAPRIDPKTNLPVDYRKITPEEINEIWMRASERLLDDDPYVALLITHHAYTLHEHTQNRTGVWKDFFITLAQRRGRIRDELGLTHNDIEHGYSYLRMANWFAKSYLTKPKLGSEKPVIYAGYKVTRADDELRIRPFPFVDDLTFTMPVIPLDKRGYGSEEEMQKALKKREERVITVTALEL